MNLWLLAAGAVVIAMVFHDAYVTTVSAVSAGGPITQRLGTGLWKVLRRFAHSPSSPVLAAAGPAIVFVILAFWLLGLWAGWMLVFSADPTAVVDDTTGELADGWSRVYFAGFAVYTLGLGDYAPDGAPWQVLTALATINGFVLLTMTVSYLIPVVMAVTERRKNGMVLHGLGDTAQQLLVRAWHGRSFDELRPHLHALAPMIASTTQQYLSYPVLHFFHSPSRETALEPGFGALHEALLLLEHGVDPSVRLPPMVTQPVRAALDRFVEIISAEFTGSAGTAPDEPDLEPLRRAGIPVVDDESLRRGVAETEQQRQVMAAFVEDARWSWQDCVERSSSR